MNKFLMNVLALTIVLAPAYVSAQTAQAPVDECSKELLLAYFPEPFVTPTLKKFNVPQDKWVAITNGLAAKDKDVLKTVEEKASKLNPNPFKDRDPAQRQVAVKIFRDTLTQVFGDVLKANGVTDDKQIASMLDDIQQQKAKNFAQCMEKQKQSLRNQVGGQNSGMSPAMSTPETSAPAISAPSTSSDDNGE